MREDELALQKAVNSEDIDLIHLTIFHLEKSRTDIQSFYRLISSHNEALNLYKVYCRNKITPTDRSGLHKLLLYNRNFLDAGLCAINMSNSILPPKSTNLENQIKLLKEATYLFSQSKDTLTYKTITDEEIELIDIHKILEEKTKKSFYGLSVTETIDLLLELSVETLSDEKYYENEINKMIKKFKLSEKLIWHIKVNCFCRLKSWLSLSKLISEKKSPIGYKPFVIACFR